MLGWDEMGRAKVLLGDEETVGIQAQGIDKDVVWLGLRTRKN
jgi:hypothetical protein